MNLIVIEGDLLDQDVDVIVNAWNRNIIPYSLVALMSADSIADDLALGSRAFIARAVWHLTRDKDNKARRLLLPGKQLGPGR